MNLEEQRNFNELVIKALQKLNNSKNNIVEKYIGKPVLVRTEKAGVHFGILETVISNDTTFDVELVNTQRIYSWSGAFTMSELALTGPSNKESKFSVAIPVNFIKAVEIIPITEQAYKVLTNIKPFDPTENN